MQQNVYVYVAKLKIYEAKNGNEHKRVTCLWLTVSRMPFVTRHL